MAPGILGFLLSENVLYGVLAVSIALVMSSIELISKHPNRSMGEIFRSRHFLGFLGLNAFFCTLFYAALPQLSGLVVESQFSESFNNSPVARALIAGFGYLLIVRTSVLDLKIKGETVGVGGDLIYNVLAQYLLRRHSLAINRRIRDEFGEIYDPGRQGEPAVFLEAIKTLTDQKGAEDRARLDDSIALIATDRRGRGDGGISLGLYTLIRDNTGDAQEARQAIEAARVELTNNPARRRELDGLLGNQ
jgi:hypothetical protein